MSRGAPEALSPAENTSTRQQDFCTLSLTFRLCWAQMSDDIHAPTPPYDASADGEWVPPTPEHLQTLLTGYEVLELVGRGGMGAVYKARQVSLDRVVAIKLLPPDLWSVDVDYAERFRQEARMMARLMHPGMVAVFDFGQTTEGQLYFVMEFVEGTDVARMIAARGALPPETARSIALQVCETLQHAHKHGIIHRDIKPANVMVNHEGRVKVADFGLAKMPALDLEGADNSITMGSPDYLAPECLITGQTEDHRVDIYGLGVMLYEMLVGIIPRRNYFPPSNRVRGLDARYDGIVARAIAHDADSRYPTAADFHKSLSQLGAPPAAAIPVPQRPSAAPRAPGPHRLPPPGASRYVPPPPKAKTPWGLLAVCVALAGAGAYFFLTRNQPPKVAPATPHPVVAAGSEEGEPSPPQGPGPSSPGSPGQPPDPVTPPVLSVRPGDQGKAIDLLKWALASGGKGVIRAADQYRDVPNAEQIPPPGDWHLVAIDCGFNMVPTDSPIPWDLLASQPQLEGFFFKGEQKVTGGDLARLAPMASLARLQFDSIDSSNEALQNLPALPALKMLRLQRTGFTGGSLPILRERAPQLEQLTLGRTPMTVDDAKELQHFTKLWELRLIDIRLTSDMLSPLSSAPALRNLGFVNCAFDLPAMPALEGVQILYVFNLNVTQASKSDWIRSLRAYPLLRSLTLMRSNLKDEDLSAITPLQKLDYLDLTNNPVSGTAVIDLASSLPRLNNLVLANCTGVTDAHLMRVGECRKLQRLDLRGTGITDAGLEALKFAPGLQLIQLQGTKVSGAGAESLRRALPRCRIAL
jgi:serine/threonine protein kinase